MVRALPATLGIGPTALGAVLLAATLHGACASDSENVSEVRLGTFNTGLAPLDVDYAVERAPHVAAAAAAADLDILCVQEVWLEEDFATLITEALPNTVRVPAEPVDVGCTVEEFEPLRACAEANCPGASGDDLASCALSMCGAEIGSLSGACSSCVISEVTGGADVDGIFAACEGPGGVGFLYEGAYDTGILTRLPILESESLILDSFLVRAAVDYARIDTDLGPLHVFCTHLASTIPTFEYDGAYTDWKGEQAHQLEELLAFMDAKTTDGGPVFLLGDLNTGPEISSAGLLGLWPGHYSRLMEAGLTNPFVDAGDPKCTLCRENTLIGNNSDDQLIDHVLLRDIDGEATAARIMDTTITIDVEGAPVETNLSDHYGVELTLRGPSR